MGFWESFWIALLAAMVGAAVGAGVAVWIMYSTRKTDREQSIAAAELQREITAKLADDLRATSQAEPAFVEASNVGRSMVRLVTTALARDTGEFSFTGSTALIGVARLRFLLGTDGDPLLDELEPVVELFRIRCGNKYLAVGNAWAEDVMAEAGTIAGSLLEWFRPGRDPARPVSQLRELRQKLEKSAK